MTVDGRIARFSLELSAPLRTADRSIEERTGFLVRVERSAADGAAGLGEATPLPGWTESLSECRSALERGLDVLRREDPDAALDALDGAPAARHGLALALADLRAREAGTALARHLGASEGVDAVSVNATVGADAPAESAAAAREVVERGVECVKVKVGADTAATDRQRLAAVREAVGEDVALRADANGAWSAETAEAAADWLAACDVDYVEQPLPADDVAGHAALDLGPVEVALDESLAAAGPDAVLAADAADVVVLKPTVLGGPYRTVAVARRARRAGLRAVVSTTVDAVVARTGAVHVAAALAPLPHCGLATGDLLATDLAADPAPVTDGDARVPEGPGTGVDPDLFEDVASR